MAIRELRASFTAQVRGAVQGFKTVRQEAQRLATDTSRSVSNTNRSFAGLTTSTGKLKDALQSAGNDAAFDDLRRAIERTEDEMRDVGQVSEAAMDELETAVRNSERSFDSLTSEARSSMSDIERAISDVNRDFQRLGNDNGLNDVTNDVQDATNELGDLEDNLQDVDRATDRASDSFEDFGDTAERESGNAERSSGRLGKALGGLVGIVAGAFAIDAIKDFGTELAATAGGAEASKAQFSTVFGDMEGEAAERLSAIGEEATILENRMKDSFTKIAAFAKTGGMSTSDSLDLADRSMRAVADSAAFYDRSLEDTTESLQSFLKGNYENDAALGLSATETTRNSAATELYGKKFIELSEAQKQLTLLQMVEDANKLTGAMGQASRESEGWENVVGNMQQAWTDFKAGIGAPVLKVAVGALKGMTAAVQALNTEAIGNGIEAAFDFIAGSIKKAKDLLEPFRRTFGALRDSLFSKDESVESIFSSWGLNPEESQTAITIIKFIKDAAGDLWKSFKDGATYVEAVFALFRNMDGTAIDLMAKLGMSVEERQKVMDAVQAIQDKFSEIGGKISTALQPAKDAIKGVFALIINQDGTAISIFNKLGLNVEQIKKIMNAVDSVKNIFGTLWTGLVQLASIHGANLAQKWSMITDGAIAVFNYLMPIIKPALEAVLKFASGIVSKIAAFWQSEGATIIQAVQNLGKVIGVIFYGIMKVVQFVMPAVLAIIKSVWGNVKGVITGALDIIMGAIKIFSGLFTGDFSKMWEGVKQLFSGAVNFLWNFIQLTFYGKILKGAKVFIGLFRSGFAAMWTGIKALFTGSMSGLTSNFAAGWRIITATIKDTFKVIYLFLKNSFNSIKSISTGLINGVKTIFSKGFSIVKNTTITIFKGIWTLLKGIFGIMKKGIQGYINIYRGIITGGWRFIATRTSDTFKAIWSFLKVIFGKMRDTISGSSSAIFRKVRDTWLALKNNTTGTFRDIYNGIKSRFTNIVDLAKGLPKRIGDGIGAMAGKVTTGVTKVINKLASTLGKGVNGVIGGINWVLGKIGVDEKNKIKKWTVPQYAKGTQDSRNGHPGGPALVNDGTGSNAGPEMIREPDGSMYMLKGKNVMANFPQGTTVWDAQKTKEMLDMIPHYDNGTLNAAGEWIKGKWNAGKKKVKAGAKKVKDVALNVFDYVKNPGKLLDLALKTLGHERPDASDFIGKMARGGWDKVKSKAIDFVKGKLDNFGLSQSGISIMGGNGGGFGAPYRLTSKPGPRNTGIPGASRYHKGWDWAAPIGTPIPSVTDGVGHRNGWHPLSGNFVEVKDNKGRVHRYQHNSKNLIKPGQKVKKGQTIALVGNTGVGSGAHLHYELKGYEDGGIVDGKAGAQLAWLTEGGWSESVISHDPAKRTSQRAIWEQTGRELGIDMDNSAMVALLERIAEGVEAGRIIKMNAREVGRQVAPHVKKTNELKGGMQDRFAY